jgi:hypothetical protein
MQIPHMNLWSWQADMNIDQMKWAIHIRCTQQFLYFDSHKKSLKQLHIIICRFSVLYLYVILKFFVFILKADESGE